jgi:hypothetical protein
MGCRGFGWACLRGLTRRRYHREAERASGQDASGLGGAGCSILRWLRAGCPEISPCQFFDPHPSCFTGHGISLVVFLSAHISVRSEQREAITKGHHHQRQLPGMTSSFSVSNILGKGPNEPKLEDLYKLDKQLGM